MPIFSVEEYIQGENLAKVLEKEGAFTEIKIRELLKGLLPVIKFIRENNVIHSAGGSD